MADWFKFYENDLDDERLQWAMSEQPHTAIVYIRMMSRCCRDKVRTLSWKDEELELFALAGTLHISVPIVNQCIGLLKRIGYIEITNGECNLLRWNERQSDYCKRKDRTVRTVYEQCPDIVRTVSDTSPLLSSPLSPKGDCKGGNVDGVMRHVSIVTESDVELPKGFPVTVEEAINACMSLCVPSDFIRTTWNKAMSRNGLDSKKVPIGSWVHYVSTEWTFEQSSGRTKSRKPYSPNI